ncbi:MAG: endonuclease [Cyclobacteriaceae bacterium]|nr:endonuclease [Cyclobacteriaceae bacterium]MCH8515473.1 endonuclease [Cyclobacteriaceae bacterium]
MIVRYSFPAFIAVLFFPFQLIFAQAPAGYYESAHSLTGAPLKTELKEIIQGHTVISYAAIWTAFYTTDAKEDGTVWDMYSDVPGGESPYVYTLGDDQCGNYSKEGDCYNREHSVPTSWFGGQQSPMFTDLFHIVATDGFVNQRRGNYPFAEVGNVSWTSQNGSLLGQSASPGYSGTVFEPIDEYKGDFARIYFYMATRYEEVIHTWNSPMLNQTSFPVFTNWAVDVLIKWHLEDPVSQKEIDRNNAVYAIQNNRNPFVDRPDFVQSIWGGEGSALNFNSSPVLSVQPNELYEYTILASGGEGEITISCPQKPEWLNFSAQQGGQALLNGTPTDAQVGTYQIILQADDEVSSIQQSFEIHVEYSVPEISFISSPILYAQIDWPYSYEIAATVDGANSDQINYTIENLPAWLSLSNSESGTATLSGTPSEQNRGTFAISIIASYEGQQENQSFVLEVGDELPGFDYTETFELMPTSSSAYLDRSWIGDHGFEWSATLARTDLSLDGRAICLRNSGQPVLQSANVPGGIGSLSFQHQQNFTGSGGTLSLYINDQLVGDPVAVTTEVGLAEFVGINISGDIRIRLVSNGQSRMAIDNLQWTTYEDPSDGEAGVFEFTSFAHSPERPQPAEPLSFTASVELEGDEMEEVVLSIRSDSGDWQETFIMEENPEDRFSFQFTTSLPTSSNEYYYRLIAKTVGGKLIHTEEQRIEVAEKTYAFNLSMAGNGTINYTESSYLLAEGEEVFLIAIADPGWVFEYWLINETEYTDNPHSFLIEENTEVIVQFTTVSSSHAKQNEQPRIYPNPFSHSLQYESISSVRAIQMTNLKGQTYTFHPNEAAVIDTSQLPSGLYVLKLVYQDRPPSIQKIIKK